MSDSGGDPIIEPTADPTAAESVRVESNTAVALLWAVMQGAGELASLPVLARSRQNAADALHESQAQRRIDPGGDPAED